MARIYRTEDGRHVPEGDLDAAVLAFGEDDQVPDEVLAELVVPVQKPVESVDPASVGAEVDDPKVEQPAEPSEKQAPAAANKARRAAANKSGA